MGPGNRRQASVYLTDVVVLTTRFRTTGPLTVGYPDTIDDGEQKVQEVRLAGRMHSASTLTVGLDYG